MICQECGTQFKGRFKQKYCSDKCRNEVWIKYLSQRYAEKKGELIKKRIEEEAAKPDYLHPEVKAFLIKIAKEQQFTIPYTLKPNCEACGSIENLREHHISYYPIIKVTLCAKCHTYLHLALLGGKRVKPRVVKITEIV
jgi:hypothetical protein